MRHGNSNETSEKPVGKDFCQQVDFDFETRWKAAKIDKIKGLIDGAQFCHEKAVEQLSSVREQTGMS